PHYWRVENHDGRAVVYVFEREPATGTYTSTGPGPQCVAEAAGVSRRARAAGSRCRTCGPGPAGRAAP
ncbi:hypothetical protein ACWD6Z_34455, partial [Streptomyces californicus]